MFWSMLALRIILTCSILILLINITHGRYSSLITDLHCYYTKDQPECGRDEILTGNLVKNSLIKELEFREEMASNRLYRPRSALARALYEKQRNDRHLQEFDKSEWYRVDKSRLDPDLKSKFVQLHADEETKEFLSASIDKSTWVWTQLWYLLAKAVLKHFWSITDINGWLGRGSMFVLSEDHARSLLRSARGSREGSGAVVDVGAGDGEVSRRMAGLYADRYATEISASMRKALSNKGYTCSREGSGAVVDVGAGDGEVSRRMAGLYADRYATEISASMRKALSSKGYTLLDTEDWWREKQFDCVCMMNLLDRCSKPKTMLRQAKTAIAPGGVLLLALVLPYKPYVEVTPDHKPEERLPIQGVTFEEQVSSFTAFMREAGFELQSWARVPYLCEGDFAQAYYWLDDSVYVFTPTSIQADA